MTNTELMIEEINEAAAMSYKWFEVIKTDNNDTRVTLKLSAPNWIKTMVHAAHEGDMMPDDYVYGWVHSALDLFATNTNLDDLINEVEPECRTWHLLAWVQTGGYRHARVDDVMQDHTSFADCLMSAQAGEKREVFHSVLGSLEEFVELAEVS